MGYQLAFQTRSRGPRTWFNFDQDTLYLGDTLFLDPDLAQIEITEKRLQILNGLSAWDMGQFDPGEMRQVQKLALGGAAEHLSHRYFDEYDPDNRRQLSSVLRLFSRVEELLLVGWAAGDLTTAIAKYEPNTEHRRRHAYDTHGLWSCIDVAEIDGLLRHFSPEQHCPPFECANGCRIRVMTDYKIRRGKDTNFVKDTQDSIRRVLRRDMARWISTETTEIVVPWKIPQLRAVHALSPLNCRTLSRERLKIGQRICNLQEEWGSIVRMEKSLPPSEWNRVKRAFEEKAWPGEIDTDNPNVEYVSSYSRDMKSWVKAGPAPDVGDLLL